MGSSRGSVTGSGAHRSSGASSSRLIADGDSVARNAFRAGLRTDTPLPLSSSPVAMGATLRFAPRAATAGVTQELDPNDILEVQDMAAAIARAEMLLASPGPPLAYGGRPDMFEALGRRATDDTAGPATPAPPYASFASFASFPTPIPPPLHTPTPIRYVTMPSVLTGAEDDAFYHPLGRMRSLADVTLDGYRPEPTLLVRAATRRKRFSSVMAAALLPLLVLAAFAGFASTESTSASSTSIGTRSPAAAAHGKRPLSTTSALSKAQHAPGIAAPPVFDVNSLPSARTPR